MLEVSARLNGHLVRTRRGSAIRTESQQGVVADLRSGNRVNITNTSSLRLPRRDEVVEMKNERKVFSYANIVAERGERSFLSVQ